MTQEKVMNRWLVVLGAVLIQFCLGAVYAWSLYNGPIESNFPEWAKNVIVSFSLFGKPIVIGGVAATFSVAIATFAVFTVIAGKIQDKIGPRWVATFGGILYGIGVILAGMMLKSDTATIGKLYLYYGLLGGAGIGIAYVCPLATCIKWFPDMRGLISGVAVAGFGAGSIIFKFVITAMLGAAVPVAVANISSAFLIPGIIYLIAVVLGAQLMIVPPAGYKPEGWEPPVAAGGAASGGDFSPGQMMKTYQFYVMWFMYLFAAMAGLMVISYAKDIGLYLANLYTTPELVAAAANAVTMIAIFNALGRIIWGTVSDKIGRKTTLTAMFLLAALAMFGMSKIAMGYGSFLALCSVIGFCFGGFLAVFPSLTAEYFGTANMGTNYGVVFMAYGVAAIIGPALAKAPSEAMGAINAAIKAGQAVPKDALLQVQANFGEAFLIAAALCLVGMVLSFVIKQPQLAE
ncbi:MAG: OFA family MFS transporter [Solirubrobacterales bacterium]